MQLPFNRLQVTAVRRRRVYTKRGGINGVAHTAILLTVLVLVTVVALPSQWMGDAQAASDSFTIAVLPDTQRYTRYDAPADEAGIFSQQTQWLVDHAAGENLVFVTHEGDIVDNGGAQSVEWQRADAAMDRLDGVVPYATVAGNKDLERPNQPASGAATYLRYFGPDRYRGYGWYGGASPNQLNQYQLFPAGGRTFLHLALELEAPDSAINWAQSVLNAHPGLPTIVTTHAYQRPSTGRSTTTFFGGNSGQQIWEKLITANTQIFMVLNGHFTEEDGERHQVSLNAAGLPVYELVANYQAYPNGGNGYLRLLQFVPSTHQLRVRTYSPTLNQFMTDSDSQFTLELNLDRRFGSFLYLPMIR